ncbi:MAG: sulfatase, partial [Saprospiraceae bacterium]|nr:sulfatase [Saprospiraceae bacterium]
VESFVQFVDFAPTILHFAGIDVPTQMDGRPFLGDNISNDEFEERTTAFSYADRFDEKYDFVRALRKGKYKYVRNYQPFNIDGLFNYYRYKMLSFREWEELYRQGKLNAAQEQFFLPRSPEALYDLEKDPDEVNNLVNDPDYNQILLTLRSDLHDQVASMPDLSFIPEPYFIKKGIDNPVEFGQGHKEDITQYLAIADLTLLSIEEASSGIQEALSSENPWSRYWGLIVCSSFEQKAASFYDHARKLSISDPEPINRMRAFEFLVLSGQDVSQDEVINLIDRATSESEANLMLNSVALMETVRPDFDITIPRSIFPADWLDQPGDLVNRRVDFINGQAIFEN